MDSHEHPAKASMDATTFRRVMGRFATGVAVVTTNVGGSLHGITVSALARVSLEPPLILVCIEKAATAHDQVIAGELFCVNLLSARQEGVSRIFAESGVPEKGRLRDVPYRIGPHGSPVLEGCLAWAECAVAERYPGGDHTVFLGSILAGGTEGEDAENAPLLYWRGAYRALR